jgi:hypothetical protein
MMQLLEETLQLLDDVQAEESIVTQHRVTVERGSGLHAGDRVEADYSLEGSYYAAVVVETATDEHGSMQVTVRYDDDGTSETLPSDHVRQWIPPTATQTSLGGPLSDEAAFGSDRCSDDSFVVAKYYELEFDLAKLKEAAGDLASASALYESAADGAMTDVKMKTVTTWSLKAAALG